MCKKEHKRFYTPRVSEIHDFIADFRSALSHQRSQSGGSTPRIVADGSQKHATCKAGVTALGCRLLSGRRRLSVASRDANGKWTSVMVLLVGDFVEVVSALRAHGRRGAESVPVQFIDKAAASIVAEFPPVLGIGLLFPSAASTTQLTGSSLAGAAIILCSIFHRCTSCVVRGRVDGGVCGAGVRACGVGGACVHAHDEVVMDESSASSVDLACTHIVSCASSMKKL